LPPFAEKVLAKLRRFNECAEDSDSGGVDIGRHWLDLLTQLGLLNRVQRSPALWEISQQGEDLLGLDVPEIEVPDSMIEKAWQRFERTLQQLETPGQAEQAEQAEAERPEVVAWRYGFSGGIVSDKACLDEWKSGGEYQSLMTVAQHERIVGALRAERDGAIKLLGQSVWQKIERLTQERDAALAEIAELEKKLAMTSDAASKGDAARHAAGGMEMEIQELKAKLADAQAGRQAGRREQSAYELLRQALKLMPLGTKKRAEWVGRTSDLLCIAQAQHSVPEISGIGRDAEHPRAVVLYLRNEPSDEDMRAIQNFLRAMLAAAPGN
ncbi:TPA: hypothetical protein NII49_006284, partial [Pseudomonas aeruginosa]|nr:hypothetical protein [Pseudomonas aeruginosa]